MLIEHSFGNYFKKHLIINQKYESTKLSAIFYFSLQAYITTVLNAQA